MIARFHQLRSDEDGQALVLAAVFALVLALCVLGTVNIGRAVHDRVQLQTACDAGAYSQAAVEARLLNFTAYTNRAMVVHYASILALSAYLTWIHFNWALIKGALALAKLVPALGTLVAAADGALTTAIQLLDAAVAALTPLIASANLVLYAFQEAAWASVWAGRLARLPPEAHSGDSEARPYRAIWPAQTALANQTVLSLVRGHRTMPENAHESSKILVNAPDPQVQQARLHLLEVANSARTPWIAYGDRFRNPSRSPLGRHFQTLPLPLGCLARLGATARTEMGSREPSRRGASAADPGAQVFSGDRLHLHYDCGLKSDTLQMFGLTTLDDAFRPLSSRVLGLHKPGWLNPARYLLGAALLGWAPFKVMAGFARQTLPRPDRRAFFISPYVYFHPGAHGGPGGGLRGELGNFAQPDVVLGLADDSSNFNNDPGARELFGRPFHSAAFGRAAEVDFRLGKQEQFPLLRKGLNAFCAAQAYYHRPGDWREMPNLFNPLWGARLLPVTESNAAAALGVLGGRNLQLLH